LPCETDGSKVPISWKPDNRVDGEWPKMMYTPLFGNGNTGDEDDDDDEEEPGVQVNNIDEFRDIARDAPLLTKSDECQVAFDLINSGFAARLVHLADYCIKPPPQLSCMNSHANLDGYAAIFACLSFFHQVHQRLKFGAPIGLLKGAIERSGHFLFVMWTAKCNTGSSTVKYKTARALLRLVRCAATGSPLQCVVSIRCSKAISRALAEFPILKKAYKEAVDSLQTVRMECDTAEVVDADDEETGDYAPTMVRMLRGDFGRANAGSIGSMFSGEEGHQQMGGQEIFNNPAHDSGAVPQNVD